MSSTPQGFQFRVPWHPTDQPLHVELAREVSKRHQLFGIEARSVARRQDCDDVLFELFGNDAPAGFAVVRLTWSGRPDQFPTFPSTDLYATFADWVTNRMVPDAEEWELAESSSGYSTTGGPVRLSFNFGW